MRHFLLVALIAVGAGCATPGEKTAIGAGGGALVGAGIGGIAGGWQGAAIGAVAGGLVGGAVGNYLDKQEQELKQVTEAQRTENGIVVNLNSTLMFTPESAVVKPAAADQLARLGDILARYPKDRIKIVGYGDSSGTPAHEEQLSLRRAEGVRDVLVSRGVAPQQMLVEGAGSAAEERGLNGRVQIFIDVPQGS